MSIIINYIEYDVLSLSKLIANVNRAKTQIKGSVL